MTAVRQVRATYDNACFVRSAVDRLRRLGVDDDRIEIKDDEDFDIRDDADPLDQTGSSTGPMSWIGHRHPLLTVEVDADVAAEPVETLCHALSPGSVLVEAL